MLTDLIRMVQGDLSRPMRQKIACLITMDAHSRDIIKKLINKQVKEKDNFEWQSQMKPYWEQNLNDY